MHFHHNCVSAPPTHTHTHTHACAHPSIQNPKHPPPTHTGHGQLLALTESVAGTYHVSLHDLTTLERHQYDKGDGVTGMLATAHPKRLCNGQLVNVNTAVCGMGTLWVFCGCGNVNVEELFAIPVCVLCGMPHRPPLPTAYTYTHNHTHTHTPHLNRLALGINSTNKIPPPSPEPPSRPSPSDDPSPPHGCMILQSQTTVML